MHKIHVSSQRAQTCIIEHNGYPAEENTLLHRPVLLLALRISQLSRIPPTNFTTYNRSATPAYHSPSIYYHAYLHANVFTNTQTNKTRVYCLISG
jgi:hypothetical protein